MSDFDAEQAFLQSMQDESNPGASSSINTEEVPKQPKTIGGFIDEDDEEDEEEYDPGASIQEVGFAEPVSVDRGVSSTPQQSLPQSPASAVPSHVSSVPAQTQEQPIANAPVPQADVPVPQSLPEAVDGGVSAADAVNVQDVSSHQPTEAAPPLTASSAQSRLPHDRVGILEDRIKDDPRGDIDAWLSLISEHRRRNKLDEARAVYDRFFVVFPQAAEQWVAYANMELDQNEFFRVEQIFGKSLVTVPNIELWTTYLNYVRRRNNLAADPSGSARQIVNQTYDFVLQTIGADKDAGPLWLDYLEFLKSGPGQIGGSGWQDQQKMDGLRKAYQRAICIPTQAVAAIWKEYNEFEMGLNKTTGRKFLQEKSPSYMSARSSNTALQAITRDLNRSTLPRLPPAVGFDGDIEYAEQVQFWRQWAAWEKEDPLVLKDEDEAAYKARVVYVYKQAVMSLRFWPEMWCEAADYCFSVGMETEGTDFLNNGALANPESCLLAFKRADRIETSAMTEEGDDVVVRRGKAVREPYDNVLDALYDLCTKIKEREERMIERIKESVLLETPKPVLAEEDNDRDDAEADIVDPQAMVQAQIDALQNGNAAQIKMLSRTISFVWIALMRAMRRVQGKGGPNEPVGGSRQIFFDARSRGRLTSDVYVASALIEHHSYKDPAATRIFERGMKLFKEDEQFALEYLKHLIAINDTTNARAVFETTVNRLAQKPETVAKAKPLYAYFHEFESRYGELSQVSKLEQRMKDLFPEDSQLSLFAARFTSQAFDPIAFRPIISVATQAKPKLALPLNGQPQVHVPPPFDSPRPSLTLTLQNNLSPKRPFDDSDGESSQPRKIARAESPLKGAAGRRLNAKNQTNLRNQLQQGTSTPNGLMPPPPPLPHGVLYLLSIIPAARTYNAAIFSADRMVELLRGVDLTKAQPNAPPVVATPQPGAAPYNYPAPPQPYAFPQ